MTFIEIMIANAQTDEEIYQYLAERAKLEIHQKIEMIVKKEADLHGAAEDFN